MPNTMSTIGSIDTNSLAKKHAKDIDKLSSVKVGNKQLK